MSDIFSNLPNNVRELVRRAAVDHPDRGITIFDGRGRKSERRSYAELADLVAAAAARFAALGIGPGEPVMVALPTSWEWLEAWMGLLFCGALPVASSGATGLAAAETQLGKVDKIMDSIGARHVIASAAFRDQAAAGGFERARSGVITPDELRAAEPTRQPPTLEALKTPPTSRCRPYETAATGSSTAENGGSAAFSDDTPLARMYAQMRSLRIADGPDEVHLMAIARRELRRQAADRSP